MTELQMLGLMVQQQAVRVTVKDGIEWWRLPDRNWLAVRRDAQGNVDVRRVPANACGC